MKTIPIGDIHLTSGKVVACDPFIFDDMEPFTVQVPKGQYPFVLQVVHFLDDDDERVAVAMMQLKKTQPVRWELAVTQGQDPAQLKEDEFYGYP